MHDTHAMHDAALTHECAVVCPLRIGLVCMIVGVSKLTAATTDSRGALLAQWSAAGNAWQTGGGLAAFRALQYAAVGPGKITCGNSTQSATKGSGSGSGSGSSAGSATSKPTSKKCTNTATGSALTVREGAFTPAAVGESGWDDKKSSTPASLTTYKYTGTASCPGLVSGRVGKPCVVTLKAKDGTKLTTNLPQGAVTQVGPTLKSLTAYPYVARAVATPD